MEPMVLFGLGLLAYCGWLTLLDCFPLFRRRLRRAARRKAAPVPARVSRPAGVAAVHWQGRRAGCVG